MGWERDFGKGTTPIRALGTVDQHSQLQLYLAGPRDKLFTLVILDVAGTGDTVSAAFASDPLTRMAFPEITATIAHLREVLGDQAHESLARVGAAMTNATMAMYALEQIDLARAHLLQAGESA